MGISTAPQLRQTYQLWKRFSMPVNGDTRDAIAVPGYVANQLNSAYTILMTSMIMNLWCILFAVAFFIMLRRETHHHLSTSIWNKRASLSDSFFEIVQPGTKGHWKHWWIYPVLVIIVFCWVAQNALAIIVPPYIIIGNAAPVNPDAVLALRNTDPSGKRLPNAQLAKISSLEVPAALRAAGSALVASANIESKVSTTLTPLGTTTNGDIMSRIDYGYTVTGADLGLQFYPDLLLVVAGACTTEYGWLVSSDDSNGYTNDTYTLFGDRRRGTQSLNLFDGAAPVAYFFNGPPGDAPGNLTWAAYISSVDRVSYNPGTDPLYRTGKTAAPSIGGTGFSVAAGRPVLSCWQTDTWRYHGLSSTIVGLNSTALPGLELSPGMQLVLAHYLGAPRIVDIGRQLGLSALLSSTTSIGNIFDAEASSAFSDLRRLILAAYIATTNTLTDTTLYPDDIPGRNTRLVSLARDESDNAKPGVGDFVVWSFDVTTLSVKAIIIIPVLSLISWLLALGLLRWSPLAVVNALDASVMHKTLVEEHESKPDRTGTWKRTNSAKFEPVINRDLEQAVPNAGGEPKVVASASIKETSSDR